MKQEFIVNGMTCNGCVASVTEKLSKIEGVDEVNVDLESSKTTLQIQKVIPLQQLRSALPEKYAIEEVGVISKDPIAFSENEVENVDQKASKWRQLRPLFLIFLYLFTASFLMNYKDWNTEEAMLDFMGLFYIVFSFFKFLDLKGFPESFKMYDPLAKAVPIYGWLYPFFELILGLLFLFRFQVTNALIATVVVLGITTIGVLQTLLNKKKIQCACLGTALKLPMTEATFIENAIMLAMAGWMLFKMMPFALQ